jgi:hypothetical protein
METRLKETGETGEDCEIGYYLGGSIQFFKNGKFAI